MYLDMARVLARLHGRCVPKRWALPISASPATISPARSPVGARNTRPPPAPRIAALERLVDWLPANMPEDDGAVSIAHGDYRVGNLMWHPAEPRVTAVLDWEQY